MGYATVKHAGSQTERSDYAQQSLVKEGRLFALQQSRPEPREPTWLDGVLFFIAIPAFVAFMFSLVGIRLISGMPYLDGLAYMLAHMFIAWWAVSWGATIIKLAFRSWQPPLLTICVLGYFASLIPAAFAFQNLGDYYASMYPVFAANRAEAVAPGWHLDYLLHFVRYSIPALPLFLIGVYGYKLLTGVNWFAYGSEGNAQQLATHINAAATANASSAPTATGNIAARNTAEGIAAARTHQTEKRRAVAGLIEGSTLDPDAELLAIKAEQHYIQIWSDKGNELVRFRFRDVPRALQGCNGIQVHRSWWVNLDKVKGHKIDGRKTDLLIGEKLTVPVSLPHRNDLLNRLAPGE
jgi:hypothetical protein